MLPKMHEVFGVLDGALAARPYLAGDAFTLADMFLYPLIWFMRLKPESAAMSQASRTCWPGHRSLPGRARGTPSRRRRAGPAQPCRP